MVASILAVFDIRPPTDEEFVDVTSGERIMTSGLISYVSPITLESLLTHIRASYPHPFSCTITPRSLGKVTLLRKSML